MKIEDIKNSIRTARTELEQARAAGIAMADDPTATTQALNDQMDKVTRLNSKLTLLTAQLEEMEQTQGAPKNLAQIADDDRVRDGAKAFRSSGDFFSAVARMRSRPDARLVEYASIQSAASG